jgi:predicted MPP superfamily phosphohydrolase
LGDYVWRDVGAVFELAPLLAGLNARYGVFVGIGNHDIWTDVNVINTAFSEVGLPMLINALPKVDKLVRGKLRQIAGRFYLGQALAPGRFST